MQTLRLHLTTIPLTLALSPKGRGNFISTKAAILKIFIWTRFSLSHVLFLSLLLTIKEKEMNNEDFCRISKSDLHLVLLGKYAQPTCPTLLGRVLMKGNRLKYPLFYILRCWRRCSGPASAFKQIGYFCAKIFQACRHFDFKPGNPPYNI